ncbi:MAG: class II fumarate hydratase [Methylibium sp.]|nr:class II fumarate hydratase [Methylibium sp.]
MTSALPTRTERDSLGEVSVPADALYGAQTQRAIDNFHLSGEPMPRRLIAALLLVKAAAASANLQCNSMEPALTEAIEQSCEQLLAGGDEQADLMTHFPIDVFQTGSGTSSNMNANEVVATLAARRLGKPVSANDDVNRAQSSNDAIPSAIHIAAALALVHELLPALDHLRAVLRERAPGLREHVKTGRTHLMDAMPVRLDQVLGGWASQIEADIARLRGQLPALLRLAQGGTAVGTGVNAPPEFAALFCAALNARTGLAFEPAPDFFAALGAQDTAASLSGQLKTCAVSLMKIANDLRWMNSGPLAGLGEIELPALQPGSSIMPGKVNPVIPEAVAMISAQVIGNDTTVTIAAQSGNFELNTMLPVIARNLLESIVLLANGSRALADKAIAGFRVNEARLQESLARNPVLVTALNPIVGYAKAAEIAKTAYREGRPVLDVADELTDLGRERLAGLLDPRALTGDA